MSEVYLRESLGTTRIRKGMLGSFPSGLLTPTVPCCKIMSIHRELCVTGIELKTINKTKLSEVEDNIVWN